MSDISHLVVVGAGFSQNAGLPLSGDFTHALLDMKGLHAGGPSELITSYLRGFVDRAFGNGENVPPEDWPPLEDLFTLIDQSANTGHHLGTEYSAAALRSVRRGLIVRLIRMLQQLYRRRSRRPDGQWEILHEFLSRLHSRRSAILSMNWDCVVERGLESTQAISAFDYGCSSIPAEFLRGQIKIKSETTEGFRLLKPHGSINWLYCDSCRELYSFSPRYTENIAQTLFRGGDWQAVQQATNDSRRTKTLNPLCPICGALALGTRLATFSYRKALEFPMHAATWRHAERLLRDATTWVFFGYSMPPADYEFKYLLKRVELSRRKRPNIVVIAGGDRAASTIKTYRAFFGADELAARSYFSDGLTREVLSSLANSGLLRAS